jgi:hypothetical protein
MSSIDSTTITWLRTRALPHQVLTGKSTLSLSRQAGYVAAFAGAGAGAAWRRPWIDEKTYSFFWARNLGQYYRQVSANKAWKRQVPLRDAAPQTLTAVLPGVTLSHAVFAYPSGVGVAVTAELTGSHDPEGLLALVARLAGEPCVNGVGSAQPKAMAAVLGGLLDDAQWAVLGQADPDAIGESRPVTLATVTETTDWLATPISQADGLHRLLEGLCRLSAAPLTGTVGNLTAGLLDAGGHPGTTRIAAGKGRAIWPDQSSVYGAVRRLCCYHENQVLATLQAGVLLDTVRWASLQPVANFNTDVEQILRNVVNVLGLLYGKVADMYASAFIRRQIDESGLVQAIGDLRIALGVGRPLS